MSGRLLGSLLVACTALAVAGGLVWLFQATPAFAQDAPEKKNCPAGFHWERYPSPIGCVQTQLPANAKIGFDGYGICEDGYVGDYERRATTDGNPAPGSPYTSFPYLFQCFTADEYAKLQAAGQLPSQTGGVSSASSGFGPSGSGPVGDAAEELYDGGGAPSKGQLAVLGVGFGVGFGLWSWGTFVLGSSPVGAGVFGGRGATGADGWRSMGSLYGKELDYARRMEHWLEERAKAQAKADRLRAELAKGAAEIRRLEKMLSFYRGRYWKRLAPLLLFGGSMAFLGAMLAGGQAVTVGLAQKLGLLASAGKVSTATKAVAGGVIGATSSIVPPYPHEEAAVVSKLKSQIEAVEVNQQRLAAELYKANQEISHADRNIDANR